jgi:hypothetical protein
MHPNKQSVHSMSSLIALIFNKKREHQHAKREGALGTLDACKHKSTASIVSSISPFEKGL